MSTLLRPAVLGLAPVLALLAVAACTTREKPVLSRAVIEARAGAKVKPEAKVVCGPLASPISVGFGFAESTLNELAVPALEDAGRQLACHPEAAAVVVGHAEDGHGTDAEQAKLASDRAQAVAADLRRRGVPAARVQVQTAVPEADARHLVILAESRRW